MPGHYPTLAMGPLNIGSGPDYKADKEKNKVFDDTVGSVSPEGKYQKPPLENLQRGVKVRQDEKINVESGWPEETVNGPSAVIETKSNPLSEFFVEGNLFGHSYTKPLTGIEVRNKMLETGEITIGDGGYYYKGEFYEDLNDVRLIGTRLTNATNSTINDIKNAYVGLEKIPVIGEFFENVNTTVSEGFKDILPHLVDNWETGGAGKDQLEFMYNTLTAIDNVFNWATNVAVSNPNFRAEPSTVKLGSELIVDFFGPGLGKKLVQGTSDNILTAVKNTNIIDSIIRKVDNGFAVTFPDGRIGVFQNLEQARTVSALLNGNPIEDLTGLFNVGQGIETGDGFKGFGYLAKRVPKPTSKEYSDTIIKLLNDNVLYGPNRKFNYNAFKALYTGKNKARQIEVLMQTTPFSKIPNWKNFRRELVDVYESLYGDVMKIKKLIRDDIDIDHLVTLRSTMPIYNNVEFGSDLWVKIQQRFLQKNYQPGNTIANLNALSPEVHQVKTNFFNKTLGKDGSKFFNKKIPYKGGFIRRKDYMELSDENRLEVLNQLIRRIDEGTRVLSEAQTVWKLLYAKGEVMPEALTDQLTKINLNQYSLPDLKNIINQTVRDYNVTPVIKNPRINSIIRYLSTNDDISALLSNNDRGINMLIDRIQGMTAKQVQQKYKIPDINRLEAAYRELTPTMVTRIMKAYGLDGKGGTRR